MPYQMNWIVDKRVMHIVIEGELDVTLIQQMVAQSRTMSQEGISPIHAITDATRAESIPKYISTIIKEFQDVKAEDDGYTVIIATSPVTRFFAQMLLKTLRLEVRFVADIDEALYVLRHVDPTLPKTLFPMD
jgi:hypothetical protein